MEMIFNWMSANQGFLIAAGAFLCGVAATSLVMGRTSVRRRSQESLAE